MKGGIFLFVGIILIGVGAFVYNSDAKVKINGQRANAEDSKAALAYVSYGLCGLGGLFALGGLIGMVKGGKQKKRNQYIVQNGIDAEGTVTFVDRNWAVLVNKNPIYSIVEYTYTVNGSPYVRKISNFSSEVVIRKQIQVGSKVPVKYAPENPAESVIMVLN